MDLYISDEQAVDLHAYIDVNKDGDISLPEFCSQVVGEAFSTQHRNVFSWMQDLEEKDEATRILAEQRMAKYREWSNNCTEEEVPAWQKEGAYRKVVINNTDPHTDPSPTASLTLNPYGKGYHLLCRASPRKNQA